MRPCPYLYAASVLTATQALIIANTRADKRYHDILGSLYGIVFFGTPHRGGNGVSSGVLLGNLLKAVGVDARTDLIRSLDPRSIALFDLTDDFRQIVDAFGITIHTFFETKKTKVGFTKRVLVSTRVQCLVSIVHD